MPEHDVLTLAHMGLDLVRPEHGLLFVRNEDHYHVGPLGRLRRGHHLQAFGLCLLAAGRGFLQADHDVGDAGIPRIEHVGMPLAAIADHGNLLALDEGKIGILLIVDFHGVTLLRNLENWIKPTAAYLAAWAGNGSGCRRALRAQHAAGRARSSGLSCPADALPSEASAPAR